eukprot:scaffold99642_cov51-Attheya_sp.AAC.6
MGLWGVLGGLVTPILCGATADWCGGAIASSKGGRFCCKEAAKCAIQSHRRTQKVALSSGTLYLQGPRVGQARLEPSIGVEDLPATVTVKEILGMKKMSEVLMVSFTNMAGQLKDEFLGDQMDSNLSSPGSWTPVELVNVELMEEARREMQSPSKLKMELLLAEMAATPPMGGPKLEPSAPIPLDNTGKGTLDESSLGIILMGWNNLLANVGRLSEETSLQNSNERHYIKKLFQHPTLDRKDWRCSEGRRRVSISEGSNLGAPQESNQDVTKEINKCRVGMGAQGS